MIEIATQKKDQCPACPHRFVYLLPFSEEDVEELKAYPFNKLLKDRITGALKERSLLQLRLYWGGCRYLAIQLSDHENILSAEDIDFEVKTKVAKENPAMIKRFKMITGIVYIEPISIAMVNMKHLEACKYFDKAFMIMGDMIGLEPVKMPDGSIKSVAEQFIELAKATFRR